ncbi:hypothetical protein FW320_08880 [Azospirillum sp. Vi22]|uniref:hypothetical protein n=1 Tax=Azospirillum baldaniorum TaxID=1064539 RepID=UPI00157A63CE|nr:hypothetical protein [Azospirillum baldaniorum]NUB06290.1 hypothetical protein [Azospirillum baldaniorum]
MPEKSKPNRSAAPHYSYITYCSNTDLTHPGETHSLLDRSENHIKKSKPEYRRVFSLSIEWSGPLAVGLARQCEVMTVDTLRKMRFRSESSTSEHFFGCHNEARRIMIGAAQIIFELIAERLEIDTPIINWYDINSPVHKGVPNEIMHRESIVVAEDHRKFAHGVWQGNIWAYGNDGP